MWTILGLSEILKSVGMHTYLWWLETLHIQACIHSCHCYHWPKTRGICTFLSLVATTRIDRVTNCVTSLWQFVKFWLQNFNSCAVYPFRWYLLKKCGHLSTVIVITCVIVQITLFVSLSFHGFYGLESTGDIESLDDAVICPLYSAYHIVIVQIGLSCNLHAYFNWFWNYTLYRIKDKKKNEGVVHSLCYHQLLHSCRHTVTP